MTRSAPSFGLLAVLAGASLACGCASNPAEPYARATGARVECPTGSHICRKVDSRTGRARTADNVISIQVNGQQSLRSVLSQLPFVY